MKKNAILIIILFSIISAFYLFHFRIDLTSDKRYSISEPTKKLMSGVQSPLEVTIYLDGDLNPGFLRLKSSTSALLEELATYADSKVIIRYENPSKAETNQSREENYNKLASKGLIPTAVYEKDKEGKSIQKIIFPWIELKYNGTIVPIGLLKNIRGNSGEENVNISIENLEFEITDGIRRLTNKVVNKIAFIEGHGELNEAETYDISKSLSKYFQIDRGVLANDASILNDYKAIIIAKPTEAFSESDKFIIDQYIMNGGRVLWLVDAVRVAKENLSTTGLSPAIELDLNLNDQLFKYGVRINPILLQDIQCVSVPINIAPANEAPQFEASPWYYAPLLLTSTEHPISRNVTEVKAEFCSGIDIVGDNKELKQYLLLASSDNTHIIGTPTTIDLSNLPKATDKLYFNVSYIPAAVAIEGNFESNFSNRMVPTGLVNYGPPRNKSLRTRQIFIADGDIIRNETTGIASDSTTIPLGFDRYMNQEFGNKEFIQNAILYLTDNDGWIQLRSKTVKLRLLNKNISENEKTTIQIVNVIIPLSILILMGLGFQFFRKRKYTSKRK